MNLSDIFRDNAEDCAFLAERAEVGEVKRALKRMEEAWRTLAQEQEQLDNKSGQQKCRPCEAADFLSPYPTAPGGISRGHRRRNYPPISEVDNDQQ